MAAAVPANQSEVRAMGSSLFDDQFTAPPDLVVARERAEEHIPARLWRGVEGDAVRLLWTEQLRVRDHVGLERHWDVVGRGRVRGLANELLHIGILLQEDPVVTHRELR